MKITRVLWPKAVRIIRSIYPPVWLFEDIADPADWDLIASAEAKTNPRVRDEFGDISLVPVERRVSGVGASMVMGAFTHVSRARPSRFSDGSFGVWYCGDRFEVALAETAYHFARFMRATSEPPAEAQYRELICSIRGDLADLRPPGDYAPCLAPDSWAQGQAFGRQLRAEQRDGVVYPSVRAAAGDAAGLYWPDLIAVPVTQGRHLRYHWDGKLMSRYFDYGANDWFRCEIAGENSPS